LKQGKKRYKDWCWGCDNAIIAAGKKCPICAYRMPLKDHRPTENELKHREDIKE
jgi:tRNA(Ile2) C34 agmatinyltransferase TiaS